MPATPPRRLVLTDQAAVAYKITRSTAVTRNPERPGEPRLTDLLLGMATETEGQAGHLLRAQPNATMALLSAGMSQDEAHTWPPAAVALRWADDAAGGTRPLWTLDLLHASCEVGGSALAAWLEPLGLRTGQLMAAATEQHEPDVVSETYGLRRDDPDLGADAAQAVARSRAKGGTAVSLLFALALHAHDGRLPLNPDQLKDRYVKLGASAQRDDAAWDAGIDTVIQTARVLRLGSEPLTPLELLRACAVAGGHGVKKLLEH